MLERNGEPACPCIGGRCSVAYASAVFLRGVLAGQRSGGSEAAPRCSHAGSGLALRSVRTCRRLLWTVPMELVCAVCAAACRDEPAALPSESCRPGAARRLAGFSFSRFALV